MEITAQKTASLDRPQAAVLIIALATAVWGLGFASPLTIALLVVAGLFLLSLKRPLWAMAAFLVSQLTVSSYMVIAPFGLTISLRLLLLVLTALLLWGSFARGEIQLGAKTKPVIMPALVLIGLSVAANLTNSDMDYVFKDFRLMMAGLLIVVLLPAVVKSQKELKILCGVALIGMIVSAIVGVMQHSQFMGMDQRTLWPNFFDSFTDDVPRVPGIGETQLELAFVLSTAIPAVLGICLLKGVQSDRRSLLWVAAVLMGVAVYFTYTRSAVFALTLGVVAIALFLKTRIRWEIAIFAVLGMLLFIEMTGVMENQYLLGREESGQEESTDSRQVLWQAGIAIAADYPVLGIGGDRFKIVSPEYASAVDSELMARQEQYWSYRDLGSLEAHNDFLGIWVSYGTLALVAYLWLLAAVIWTLHVAYVASKRRFIKGLSIGLAAALVAYVANAFYHNLMATLPLFWILVAFSLAAAKFAHERNGGSNTRDNVPGSLR
jgi:hypothetical protein